MKVNNVEVFFRDDERASGIVTASDNDRIPWTAVKGFSNAWFIVLHGKMELDDADLECRFLEAIDNHLQLAKAA